MDLVADRHTPRSLLIARSKNDAESLAAQHIAWVLVRDPEAVLGLATGETQRGVYKELIALHRAGFISFSKTKTFNLDEYIGAAYADHSFAEYMRQTLFNHVDMNERHINLIDGSVDPPMAEVERYSALLQESGGIDLQLLGLGRNGHIGFNEPGALVSTETRIVELSESTIMHNRIDSKGVANAITMGIADILAAREVLIVALGEAKSPAVAAAMTGPVDNACPASFLQLHPNVHWILDLEAADQLSLISGHRVDDVRGNTPSI